MAWEIDPAHSLVEFSIIHLMINTVKGRFLEWNGTIHLDPKQMERSRVVAQIKAASIQTGVAQRDAHLRSADFFDVSRYPTILFESTGIQLADQHRGVVTGQLSLHGVTRSISLHGQYTGRNRDLLTGAWRMGLFATVTIDRRDFGITFNQISERVALVGYQVRIEINAEAILM